MVKGKFDKKSKYQVSKYYEHDCLQKFCLLFMYFLTGQIAKNSHILAGIYLIFLKGCPRPNLFITNNATSFQLW